MIYFTSDLHLYHHNIISYCQRPFRNVPEMNASLLNNWNSTVHYNDVIFHLGDFCFNYGEQSYGKEMHNVNGKTSFLRGNHDKGLQHAGYYQCLYANGFKIFIRHWPPWQNPKHGNSHLFTIPPDTDIILCGHVHNEWMLHTHKIDDRYIPVINVGTDVWNYKPVSLDQIIGLLNK